ncbi:MAG: hypothetical protein NXH80_13695 [Rhodobacteraceae bacterium]|nr:hypothetical protein [Paracoccaceae bacterium]
MVDVVYYTVGMLGILLFLWSQADSERRFPFKLDITLSDAITENSDEIEAAKEFSRMFYDESDFLISVVNRYLSEAPSRNVEASCVHDFSLYESMHVGLVNIDKSAILIRSSVGLKSDAPEKVISRCSAMFGGKRFRDNLIFSFFPRENNVIESSHFPFDSIESVEVLERELYLFLPMRLPESEMRVSEYVEYLLDDEGKILNIDELEFISEIDRDYVRIPLNQPWIDSYVVAARRVFGANFENTIWPFIAIYLFALKIASGSRSRK